MSCTVRVSVVGFAAASQVPLGSVAHLISDDLIQKNHSCACRQQANKGPFSAQDLAIPGKHQQERCCMG